MADRTPNADRLLYAQCWEDQAILRRALVVRPGDDVLSIASAGDNTFALLLDDPASVTAVDRNTTQIQLIRLKMAALATLDREDTVELLGAAPSRRRKALYAALRAALPDAARAFWDGEEPQRWLARGVLGVGKFERYLSLFRERVLPLVHGRATVERLAGLDDREEQERFYRDVWDTRRWRVLFRIFFGRRVMGRIGRERAFFAHVDAGSVGDAFRERARWALTEIPVRTNPYLSWILTGEHRATRLLPPYLQPGHYETVAARLDRVRLVADGLTEHLADGAPSRFDGFNLSDVFEYMDEAQTEALFHAIAHAGRPGARLCYWNLLVPRERPDTLAHLIERDAERAAALHAEDRAFFYGKLVVERLRAPSARAGAAPVPDRPGGAS